MIRQLYIILNCMTMLLLAPWIGITESSSNRQDLANEYRNTRANGFDTWY